MNTLNFPGHQIGDYRIMALSDGYLSAGLELLSPILPQEAAALQQSAGMSDATAVHINCYLITGRGRTLLVDAGAGGVKQWGGTLLGNLARAGVTPAEIDAVLLTHAHPDHIGGLLDAAGEAVFPAAELVVNQHEVAFWQDDGHLSRASERARGNFLLARKVFDRYRPSMRTFISGELFAGIVGVPLPGHSAGHCGYRIESGQDNLLIWGDIVHFPHIQIARPEVSIAFDLDPQRAAATRVRLLDQVSADRLLIAGMHLDTAGFARIEPAGRGWRLVSEP